jgi:hypothetical protein
VLGFERGNLLFLDCAWNFDGTAYRSTKFLLSLQVADIISPRLEPRLRNRLRSCGLQSLG